MNLSEAHRIKSDPSEWKEPTIPEPPMSELESGFFSARVPATDGCVVEPDGVCPHGHVSWLVYKQII